MTLVLSADWSAGSVTVTVTDIAVGSIVANGNSATNTTRTVGIDDEQWHAFGLATRTALDEMAALSLTSEDIRFIELSDAFGADVRARLLSGTTDSVDDGQIGTVSIRAAEQLGLSAGCPVHRPKR